MKTNLIKSVIAILILSSIFSCSPKDGAQGPTGTANVMYSDWMDQNWNGANFATIKSMDVIENRLTVDFSDNGGIVLGFFKLSASSVFDLPYNNFSNNTIRECYTDTYDVSGKVHFLLKSTDGSALSAAEIDGTNIQYRYVLIPGGINISGRSSTDFKKMSYQEICNYFNIPE